MLKLFKTELLMTNNRLNSKIQSVCKEKLPQNIGVIQPSNIEVPLLDLKKYAKTKSAASPVLLDAINLYENLGGRIQLFNLNSAVNKNVLSTDVPTFMPFVPSYSQYAMRSEIKKPIPAIFVNLYKMGNWSPDGTVYEDLYPITDLQTCLESGYIAYKMIIENKADDILSNALVMEYLTRIYTKLFYDALIKVPGNLPLLEFQQEAAKFIIAKFFLIYILEKNESDPSVNVYAQKASNATSSVQALQTYEENLGIRYEKLSIFLSTFGIAFFNGNPTSLSDFERAWITMYGEGLALAIEYVPYLLHFLFAPIHASKLGGASKMHIRFPALQKEGLIKLYNAVLTAIRK